MFPLYIYLLKSSSLKGKTTSIYFLSCGRTSILVFLVATSICSLNFIWLSCPINSTNLVNLTLASFTVSFPLELSTNIIILKFVSSYLKLLSGIETVNIVVPILKSPHFFNDFEIDLFRTFFLLSIFGLENKRKLKLK